MELTVEGRRVHAATGGRDFDPSLPAVVFVHGAGLDRTVWALQTRYFAHHGYGVGIQAVLLDGFDDLPGLLRGYEHIIDMHRQALASTFPIVAMPKVLIGSARFEA